MQLLEQASAEEELRGQGRQKVAVQSKNLERGQVDKQILRKASQLVVIDQPLKW
jgi:hypothetical protein